MKEREVKDRKRGIKMKRKRKMREGKQGESGQLRENVKRESEIERQKDKLVGRQRHRKNQGQVACGCSSVVEHCLRHLKVVGLSSADAAGNS